MNQYYQLNYKSFVCFFVFCHGRSIRAHINTHMWVVFYPDRSLFEYLKLYEIHNMHILSNLQFSVTVYHFRYNLRLNGIIYTLQYQFSLKMMCMFFFV